MDRHSLESKYYRSGDDLKNKETTIFSISYQLALKFLKVLLQTKVQPENKAFTTSAQ